MLKEKTDIFPLSESQNKTISCNESDTIRVMSAIGMDLITLTRNGIKKQLIIYS